MIRRLVEAHFFEFKIQPSEKRVAFWLEEARTPQILSRVARQFPEVETQREAALLARQNADEVAIEAALKREEDHDRAYWAPLKRELEELRRRRNRERDT